MSFPRNARTSACRKLRSQAISICIFNHLHGPHLEARAYNQYRNIHMTKLAANRANAQHSTGPKDTMKTRFNGVRHGLTSKQTVIPGECQQEYDEFQARFLRDLNPQSEIERTMAERTIAAAWRLKR